MKILIAPKEPRLAAYLNGLFDLLDSLPDYLIYIVLGLSAFVENVFPPIPGDTITAFGAFLVGTNRLDFVGVFMATTVGSLCGFMTLFWTGIFLGRRFFIERDYRFFSAEQIIRAEEQYRKYGYLLVLLNRFLPGIRSVISLAGGISKLKGLKVLVLALISACAWNLIWIYLGRMLGSNWDIVRDKMAHMMIRYNVGILSLAVLVGLVFLVRKVLKRPR
ncbi:MAG: DedA family protein [Thermodesulfobacteriota bacterium]|nr:DedA family protein [Thermodesulfobacteriota bacterium]